MYKILNKSYSIPSLSQGVYCLRTFFFIIDQIIGIHKYLVAFSEAFIFYTYE